MAVVMNRTIVQTFVNDLLYQQHESNKSNKGHLQTLKSIPSRLFLSARVSNSSARHRGITPACTASPSTTTASLPLPLLLPAPPPRLRDGATGDWITGFLESEELSAPALALVFAIPKNSSSSLAATSGTWLGLSLVQCLPSIEYVLPEPNDSHGSDVCTHKDLKAV